MQSLNKYKHITTIPKNVYFNVLDDIVNKYNKTVNRTRKVKPIDIKSDSYPEYNENSNEKDTKVCGHVGISKCIKQFY